MREKSHFLEIVFVVVALMSASCFGQEVGKADRSLATIAPLGVAQLSFDSDAPSSKESNSAESGPIAPVFAGAVAPNRQPGHEGAPFWGERNDAGIFSAGNFNPVTYISIQNVPHTVISSNKSSVGGSAEYRHWFSDRSALGVLYTQNPSDGKLLWQGQNSIWPQMRWDLSILVTERLTARRIAPFVCGGSGVVVTNGYSNSGWSAGFAFVGGLGTDYQISRRFAARTGVTFFNTKGGCYEDPTCHETWGVVEDVRVGLAYRWGGERAGDLGR